MSDGRVAAPAQRVRWLIDAVQRLAGLTVAFSLFYLPATLLLATESLIRCAPIDAPERAT